jgi:hypothetical protein
MNVDSVGDLNNAIASASDSITIGDCPGYFSLMREFAIKGTRREYF